MSIFDLFKRSKKNPDFETHIVASGMSREYRLQYYDYGCENCHNCQHGLERDNDCRNGGWCPNHHQTATSKIDYLNPEFAKKKGANE